ncbi:type IV secretion system protein [Anaplasma phagocytophilum]|uniref:type IV secretion system protein n=1 Tax=Anaplasma phagocytophilum TaxID=948 RepID=UPI003D979875
MVIRFTRSNFLRLLVISCLFMTSCGNEVPFPRCVSADNFNSSTTIAVSAYYGSSNVDAFKAENGELGDGSVPGSRKQIVRWQDTGLVTDGAEIVVKVEGAWIPWEKNGEKHSPTMAVNAGISRPTDLSDEFYDSVVDVDRICGPYQKYEKQVGGCRMQCRAIPMQDQDSTGQYGRPCWLEKGYGAYLLFKRPNDQDPNATMDLIEFPESPTTHLAYESAHDGGEAIYRSSGRIYDVKCQVVNPERGWKVYVKILDNYYHDNAGGYSLEFTKGVVRGTNTDIFESVRKLVRDKLDSAGKKIFQNIAKDKEYKNFVFALITLSIVLTALTYIFGMVRAPLADLIAKLLKIVLVLLLISPGSWDFFYNHLLRLFLEGVDEIIAVVNEYALGQKVFNKNNPFSFMDIMIRDKIFSTVVWEAKARALITADWSSIFALLIIIIAVLFYVGLCLYGFVIYLTAFVGVTFLISLMPILFVGILFSRFKSLFDGWLTQCISFSMQAILMFTLIAMFGTLIMHYYYRIFGFTACYNEWIHVNIPLIINRGYYEWTPGQKYDTITIGKGGTEKRAYPEAGASARYTFTGGGAVIRVPPDYKDEDFRYVDYPFLDPDTKSKTVPGGVVPRDDTDQGRKFQNLAALVNMLVASERGSSIARIVNKIEKELKQLRSSASVTDVHLSKFEDLVSKKRKENPQANWSDPVFKKQLLDILISEIIANNAFAGTPLKELEEQYDYSIIKNIKQGWIVMWSEVFGLILIAFLVWQMRAFVQSIAVVLSGGGMMSRTVASMYNEGFARIFSGIPVFGRVIETVDRSIDVARLFARAKIAGIGSAIAEAPEKLIARVPIVGGTIGGMVKGMRHVSGALMSSHTEADLYSMKSISPRFDYARAWLGAHLGYSPLDALQYVGKFSLAKMMGNTSGGLLDNIRQDHAKVMQNLRTLTIGVDKYKPGVYVPKRDEEADKNPFRRPDAAEKRKDEEDRAKLFDDNGNLHIHRGNFWDAVDAMHGLEVMRGQTNDDAARERIQRDIDRIRDEIVRLSRANSSEVPELQDFVMSGGGVDFDRLRDAALKRRNVDERDEISGAEAARQGVVSQAEERSVADLISGTGESEASAGGSQALTEERIQGGEGTGDRALPEGIEVGGHELADSASALPENQEGGVDSTAEVVSQAEERSVADLISGTGESEASAGGSQALTEERIQGGEGTGDRALPEGIEVGGHELADSASALPENQEGGVDSTAEVVSQAEERSVADLISGTGESAPSARGSQALIEERIQGGEGTGDRALPEGIEVGGHELADSASALPENQEGGVDSTAEVVSQAEESSVADLMSGASDSSSDVSSDTSSDNGDDVNHALKEESSVTNVGDMEIAEGSGSAFSDPEVRQGGDRSVEVPHAANAAGVRVEDHYHIEDLLSDVGVSDGSSEINFVREESSELGVHEGEGSNYPQKGLSKEKHKGRGTKASSSKRDDKDGAHSGSKTDDDSSGLKASGGSKEGARFRNESGKAPPSGDRVDSEAISVGEDALEAIASVPEAEALKTVDIPLDKEVDKRDPDEVKAGKKKEEREEIGLIVPSIDPKAELEGDKSEEAPAISGIKQDAVVDSRIIEESRVDDKHYTGEGKPLAEVASADVVTEENVVSAGDEGLDSTLGAGVTAAGDVLEATASAPGDAALKTVDIPVDKEGDKRDPDEVKAGKKKEERGEIGLIVPSIDKKAELEGDKSEEAPAISGIKQDAVVDSRIIEESRVDDKHYTGEGKPLAEVASADMVAEENVVSAGDEGLDGTLGAEVTAAGDALEATASAPGDAALETVDIPVYQEKGSGDSDVKGFSREDGRLSEVTELDAQRDDPEKYGNTATELPREVVPEATEYGTKPDDQDGDKSDSRPEGLDPDIGDAGAIEDEVEVRSSRSSESTDSVPSDDAAGVDKHYSADYESPEGMAATETEAKAVVTGEDVLEATASAPGDAALETVEIPVYQEKGSDDADVKGFSREDGRLSEVTELDAQRDDQEKDDNTATELPREVVPEATEYATKPDDPDGDKSDLRLERLDPDIRGGSAEVDAKHEVVGDESPSKGISTEDAQDVGSVVEASRVDDKHYTGEGNPLAEVASTDVATEENVVSAGDEGLDGTLGAGATASAPGDAALETLDVPVYQEKGSDDADVKGFSREDGRLSEVTELDAQRDDPEKDGNTATELPREVVPEATEYGTRRDDPDGDKGDARPERLDPDTGDGSAIEDEVEVRSSRDSESTYSVPSDDAAGVDKHYSADDEYKAGMVSTEDVPGIDSGVEASRVEGKDHTGEGEPLAEAASSDVATEDKVVPAGDEALEGELGAEGTAAREALEPAASVELETAESCIEQVRDSGYADVKDLPREDGRVTELDAQRDDQEKDGNTATELLREVVPEATEYGTKPDDQDGDKSDSRPERLDPGIGDGSAIEDEVEVRSSRGSESTYSVPSDDAAGVDKHYSADDESPEGIAATATEEKAVVTGEEVLEATASVPEAEALKTVDIPVYQEKGSDDADVKGFSREDGRVTELDAQRDDQEKDGNTATELPREVVPEATEYGTKPDDQDGDKGDLRPERLDPDIGDGAAIEDEVEVRSSRGSESTYSVPSYDAAGVDKHYSADDESPEGIAATETEAKAVVTGGDVLEATASAPGDAALETLDVPVYQEKGSDDADVKGFSREDGRISEVTELDAQRDDQEKDDNTATELPREVVPEATEYGTKPDDPDGDKSDSRPERLDPDTGDGSAIEDEVEVRSSRGSESTYSVPSDDAAAGVDKHYSADDESPEGIAATEAKAVVTGEEVLEATASVPEAEALKTVDIPVYQEKGSGDADVKGSSREDAIVSEAATRPDDQEKDGNTATELPREVVPEDTEYGTKPDDQDGEKSDSRPERLDPDIGGGSAELDAKHEVVGDESPVVMVSTEDVPNVEASRVEDKHYTVEGKPPAEVASTDVVTEENVVSAGDEGLDSTLGAGVTAVGDVLEAAASAPGDAALETLDVPVYQEKGSDDSGVKGFYKEDGRISEVTELDAQRDDQEKDGNTATELPREVVPEATEYGTKPDDPDGDKSDSRPERLDPDTGDGSAIEDEVEVRSSRGSESTDSVPSDDAAGVDKHYSADDGAPEVIAATETEAKAVVTVEDVLEATASASEDAALETVDIPVDKEGDKRDPDEVKAGKKKEEREEIGLIVPSIDQKAELEGDKSEEAPAISGIKQDDVVDSRIIEASRVEDKHYTGEGESPAEVASTDVVTEENVVSAGDEGLDSTLGAGVTAAGDVLEATASALGDAALEAVDIPVDKEKSSDDADVKGFSREDGGLSEVTELDAQRDDQEKDDNTATELPREVVPEATEYGTKPDDQDGDKGDARPERLDPDTGDAGAIKDEVEVRSSRGSESTYSVPSEDAAGVDKHYSADDESPEGMAAIETEAKAVVTGEDVLEAAASVPGDAALETVDIPVYQEKGSDDADVKDPSREDAIVSEVGTRPDDPDGDKSDSRPERLDPDIGGGSAEVDAKHEVVGDESPVVMVSTEDVPNVEASGVKGKDYSEEGKPLAETSSTDVVAEEKVVSAGGEGLDGTLGAGATAGGDVLEATASVQGDAALETVDIPVYQEKGSDDADVKGFSREDGRISEVTELDAQRDDPDGEKGDSGSEKSGSDSGDAESENESKERYFWDERYGEVLFADYGKVEDGGLSEVTEPDAQRDDQEKDGNTATELPREVVPEATEYGTKPDDPDGDKSDSRPERLDPDIRGGSAIEDEVEVRSSRGSESTDSVPSDDAAGVDKHYSADDEYKAGMVSTEDVPNVEASRVDDKHYTGEGKPLAEVASSDVATEDKVVPAGDEALEGELGAEGTAAREALEPAASVELETAESCIEQVRDSGYADVKGFSGEDAIVSEAATRPDDQEKDGNTATELPREVVPEATEYGTKPDDPDGDKSDSRPERLGPDIWDGGLEVDAKREVVGDKSPVVMVSTENVPNVEASGVKGKDYSEEGKPLAETSSTDVVAEEKVVSAGGEGLDGTLGAGATAVGDVLEATASASEDAALETLDVPVYQEKGSGDADVKGFSREDGRISEVTELDAQRDDQEKDGNTATELPREVVPEATEYGTKPDDQDGDKSDSGSEKSGSDSGDAESENESKERYFWDERYGEVLFADYGKVEDGGLSEVTELDAQRDDQEKDDNTATELPREVVPEATEYGTKPDDQDGDKGDLRLERLDPDIRGGSAEVDAKHEVVGDESPVVMVSTEDVPGIDSGVEASRVEGKDHTGEGEPLAEAASSDVATEDKVVSAGDEALEGELGAEGTAAREALEPAASVELETAESCIEQVRDSGYADVKDLPREDAIVSEAATRTDDQEKDGNTATELPREVVPEATEYGTKPDDQDGDKGDLRPERLDPYIGDGGAIEDEVEVRSSRDSESTDSVPSDDAAGVDKHYSADDAYKAGMVSTEDAPDVGSVVEGSGVEGKDYTVEGKPLAEVASTDVVAEENVVSAGDEGLDGTLGAGATASVQEDAALETLDVPVYQEKGSGDADVKGFSREDGRISEVTEPDAQRDDPEKYGNTATELPREVVPEATEYATKPDDPDGDKSDSRPERLDPYIGDGSSIEDEVEVRSSRGSESTYSVPSDDAAGVDKHYSADDESPEGIAATATEEKAVVTGEDVLEATASVQGDAALETVDIPVYQEKGSDDADVKGFSGEDAIVSEAATRPDDQEKDDNTATELPKEKEEIVPEATEYGTKPDDQDGDKGDARPERLDPDTGDGSAIEDEVEVRSSRDSESTYSVPSDDAAGVDKHYSADDESPEGIAATETEAKAVVTGGDVLEATASAPGDAALETLDVPVYQEKGSDDADVKGFSREDGRISEVTELDAQRDDQEKDDNTATELPREVVPEATEYGTKPDDQDGDKGDSRPERLDPYIGDGSSIEDEVEVRSSRGSESTYSVPSDDAAGVDKHYSADDESPEGIAATATEEKAVVTGEDVLEATASVQGDAALETVDIPVYQEKGSDDADVKGFSGEDAIVSEAATRPDDQEKDDNTATELPKEKEEIVPEATEYGTKPDDQDGDKGDARPERLDPDTGDGSAIEDEVEVRSSRDSESTYSVPSDDAAGVDKHYSADDEYKAGMVSTEDVPGIDSGVEASRVEGKDHTGEGEPLAEAASSDVATEDKVVPAGDEALEGELGAEGTAAREALEPAASVELETAESCIEQVRDSGYADVKDLPREDGRVTELDAQRDDQEKDGNTATELLREVVPEATEYGTKPDDQDGDKSDSRPERLDPGIGDGSAIEDEVEVRSSRGSESTYSVPSDDAAGVDKHYSADDESPEGIAATATEEKAVVTGEEVLEATASVPEAEALKTVDIPVYQEKGSGDADVKGFSREDGRVTELDAQRDDQEKDGNTATELPREVVPEATEYGTKPDDQDGDKGDLRPERLDPDIGDGAAIEDEVEVRSSRGSESTYSVPSYDAAGVDKHYSADDESPEGIAATETEAKAVVTGGDVLEATASAPGDAALETLDVPVYQEKGSDDADVKGFSREDGRISEVTELDAQRDDQEKDDNTATELPREVVPEATEYGTKPDDPDGDKSDSRPERLDPDTGDGSAIEDEVEVRSSRGSESTYSVPSDDAAAGVDKHYSADDESPEGIAATEAKAVVTGEEVLEATASVPEAEALKTVDIPVYQEKGSGDADVKGSSREDAIVSEAATRPDDQEKDGNTATELPREVVPEDTEYGTKPDDQDGEKSDSRPERLDPDIGGGSAELDAKHEVVGDESPVVMVSTEDVPNVEASRVEDKHYTVEGKPPAEVASTDVVTEENVVSAGDEGLDSTLGAGVTAVGDVLEAAASAPGDAALETLDIPVYQEKGSGDADVKGSSREDAIVSEAATRPDDQEKDGNTATELPREVVPEDTEYGTKPDDQDGEKSDSRPERLDPDIGGGSAELDAKHEVVGDESPVVMVSTEDVPNVEASRVEDKHYTVEGKPPAEVASTDVVTEENVVSAGDEGLDSTLGAGVTAVGDVLEAAASAPGDAALETLDVPVYQEKGSDDSGVKGFYKEDGRISEVTELDAQRDDQEKDGNTATELPREVVPEATEYGTKPDDPDGDKSDSRPERLDPDTGDGSAIEDEVEVRSSRGSESTDSVPSDDAAGVDKHYSADDGAPEVIAATETEAKAVVTVEDVLEATASASEDAALETVDIPVDKEGDKRDPDEVKAGKKKEEREEIGLIVPSIDQKAELEGDKSEEAPAISGIKQDDVVDSRIIEASRVEDKHYTGEGESPAEVASTDVVTEENVVSAGDEGLDSTLGAGVTAAGDVLEATASALGDAALEAVDIPVDKEKSSDDADVKGFSREDGGLSEVTELDAQRDDQEKDDNTATELPREVVPEATEYGTKPDDQDGDKGDARPERLDPDTGDGSAIEDEVEVRSSKKTLLMRRGQIDVSVVSTVTKDIASEARKSDIEKEALDRDVSSRVAVPIEDRGLLKTESNVATATQKQVDADASELLPGTSSNKKKAKEHKGKSKKKKSKRKEEQLSGVSTDEILKGLFFAMTSENISHQDKSLPEKDQEQDASKETHQDEKKKSQEKAREEKAQKQKSSISKMQRKISKLKGRIAQGNLTEGKIQVLRNKIAEIEACINELDS